MRCFFLFLLVGTHVSARTCENKGASSGVVLLQRKLGNLEQVDVDHGQHHVLARPALKTNWTSEGTSLIELAPSLEHEADGEVEAEAGVMFVLMSGEWGRFTPRRGHKIHGPHHFWTSVVVFDWCLFASAIIVFLVLHMLVLGRMEEKGWHLSVLIVWLVVGAVYNMIIWARFGSNAGMSWFAGYVLEFIFLVENIFIFHIVIQAFKTPVKLTTKALHIVVWAQIAFEMVFFMGLAAWLRSFKALPYILGIWLICCGILAARGEPSMDINLMESIPCKAFTTCLGDRLSPSYEKDGECMLRDVNGRMKVSLLGLVVVVLLAADFLLEIDVVLTKIEELPNPYIAFTSSAVAAFSIPELFFVSKGLLKRFRMLKYGIGFVLMLFGAQMLLSSIYILRPIVACSIIIGVLITCIVFSFVDNYCGRGRFAGALLEVGQGEANDVAREADAAVPEGSIEADGHPTDISSIRAAVPEAERPQENAKTQKVPVLNEE